MKRTKQILSVFLSVCMIISCMAGISVTASAASKPLAVGTIYNIGDAIVVSADNTRYVLDDDGNLTITLNAGSYTVTQPSYKNNFRQWYFNSDRFTLYLGHDTTDGTETVTGIKCVSGDGTNIPYTFELVCASAPTADTSSESFATNQELSVYTGEHFTISVTSPGDEDGFYLDTDDSNRNATITALNGEIITKVELILGWYYIDRVRAAKGTVTYGSDVATVSEVNDTSLTVYGAAVVQIKAVKVYYTAAPTAYKINMSNGGKALVNQQEVTEAAAGDTVTVVAPQADPGTQFNGWTTTTAGVEFADATASTTTFTMPASDATITASFENIAYNITMLNGAKAYVNQQEVTAAEAYTVVTIVAPQPDPGTEFNGWTTTTAGVAFADPTAPTTTFTMPASDATITASFENILYSITVVNGTADKETAEAGQTVTITADRLLGATFTGWTSEDVVFRDASSPTTSFVMPIGNVTVTANYDAPYIKPVPAPSGGSTTPSHSSSSSSSSSSDVSGTGENKNDQSTVKMWAQLNDDHSVTVGWDKISGASKYVLCVESDGKVRELTTTEKTKVKINIKARNNVTYKYTLKYITSGQTLDAPTGYTASLKVYYKPAVKLTQKDGKVTASWKKVPGADSYKVYKVVNGKLKFVTETTKNAVRFSAKSGSTVTYSVSAVVGGNETKLTKSDRVSIKVK